MYDIKIDISLWWTKTSLKWCGNTRTNSPCCHILREQVFVFCRLTNKNLLEWLLQTICKDHTLRTSANLISRNHLILCSWLFWARWWLHDPGLPGWNFPPSSRDRSHYTITCGEISSRQGGTVFHQAFV